jgi:hypothetical protein
MERLYGNWNKIEGLLVDEFRLVWEKVIEKSDIQMVTDDNSSVSGSDDDSPYD